MVIEKYPIFFDRCVKYDGYYWFVAMNYRLLCRMKIDPLDIEVVCPIPGKKMQVYRQYFVAAAYKGSLFLVPEFADDFLEYVVEDNHFIRYELDFPEMDPEAFDSTGKDIKFRSAVVRDTVLWMMPYSCHKIIAFDMEKHRLDTYTDWYDSLKPNNWQNCILFGTAVLKDNRIYMPCFQKNAVVEFDPITKKPHVYSIGNEDNRFFAMASSKEGFWLLDNEKGSIYLWNTKKVLREINFPEQFKLFNENDKYLFGAIYESEELLILAPATGNAFVGIDLTDERSEVLMEPGEESQFYNYSTDSETGKMLIPSETGNQLVVLDTGSNKLECSYMYVAKKDIDYFDHEYGQSEFPIYESEKLFISSFLTYHVKAPTVSIVKDEKPLHERIGQKIWKQM